MFSNQTVNIVALIDKRYVFVTMPLVNDDFVFSKITSHFFGEFTLPAASVDAQQVRGIVSELSKIAAVNIDVRELSMSDSYGFKSDRTDDSEACVIPDYRKIDAAKYGFNEGQQKAISELYESLHAIKPYIADQSSYNKPLHSNFRFYSHRCFWINSSFKEDYVTDLRAQLGVEVKCCIFVNNAVVFSNIDSLI